MANQILLEIVTPTKLVVSQEVDLATIPGADGVFGVMANHAPLIATLKSGEMRYATGGDSTRMAVSGGFCEVSSNNRITLLAESVERAEEIDIDRALRAKERAERRLAEADAHREKIDMARAQAALTRAMTRLRIAGHQT
ncbi:MAG TPA: F0F1 ATP synthase subunit epsilon [Thermodesulfobacteriaceae bacterium]|nr:F0F1 ATP synthase subunit epsilon [Thermodesulfobacteriaceae bacterium]